MPDLFPRTFSPLDHSAYAPGFVMTDDTSCGSTLMEYRIDDANDGMNPKVIGSNPLPATNKIRWLSNNG